MGRDFANLISVMAAGCGCASRPTVQRRPDREGVLCGLRVALFGHCDSLIFPSPITAEGVCFARLGRPSQFNIIVEFQSVARTRPPLFAAALHSALI